MMNIQGMDPSARSAGRYKIDQLRSYVDHKSDEVLWVPFISITDVYIYYNLYTALCTVTSQFLRKFKWKYFCTLTYNTIEH